MLAIGFLAAFVTALFVVRLLIRFVAAHKFKVFAWYGILAALSLLLLTGSGVVSWAD